MRRPGDRVTGSPGIPEGGSGGGLHLATDPGSQEQQLVAVLSGRRHRDLPRLDEAVYRPVDQGMQDFLATAVAGGYDRLPGGTATSLRP